MLPAKNYSILIGVLLLGFFAVQTHASSSRNCILKANVVDIQKLEEQTQKIHPDVTFGGVCYDDFYYAQIAHLEINNSFYLGNSASEAPYCEGLIEMLSEKSRKHSNRPIGVKLCMEKQAEPPKTGDIIDIRYNWSMGRTDTKAAISWKYLSLFMDRESRKATMSKQCDTGDGSICIQLGQMHWQDKDEDGEIESYRKACKINKASCTYYINAMTRTGRLKEPENQQPSGTSTEESPPKQPE